MDIIASVLKEITEVVQQVKIEDLEKFISFLTKDQRIFVSGEGRSGLMAKGFAMRLMHLGYKVYVIGETITPSLKEEDVFIAISGSGKSEGVLIDTQKAKKKGCKVLAVTGNKDSSIAKLAVYVLMVPGTTKAQTGEERKSVQLLSSLFDQSLHIVLDIVCLLLSIRDQTSNEEATMQHW
jgi:6-phospho-3-hexuloisomerase